MVFALFITFIVLVNTLLLEFSVCSRNNCYLLEDNACAWII
ncbi:unnamed protein product [Acanthoscelides obtectus]|uniref:Uncharacterized protein n=1 Tax=Acanthoscelides obtectus TaxID=200917 RepID=A0A9P0NSZ2_ACAOB|nr:unnamed protein product [Acanthoscelides obtectus]CAK1621262.1 hypothetical protein AOBTE_LOCUS854 [Acanthoscelides obtectus]